MKTVKAGKVRKGALILIEGKQGPVLVTKREKWNSTHCRVYFSPLPGFEYVRLDHEFTIYEVPGLDDVRTVLDSTMCPARTSPLKSVEL
jgi:hypothetical protein